MHQSQLASFTNYSPNVKRLFDFVLAAISLVVLAKIFVLLYLMILVTSTGPVFFWTNRIGRGGKIFKMPKFRSMAIDTPNIASHLLRDPQRYITTAGKFLRDTSIDELPQLWSILKGDMSFVGPRPALFNQDDLIALRIRYEVDQLLPGLTGWAQVNGRDEVSIEEKVALDVFYLKNQCFSLDLKILWLTLVKVVRREGVSH